MGTGGPKGKLKLQDLNWHPGKSFQLFTFSLPSPPRPAPHTTELTSLSKLRESSVGKQENQTRSPPFVRSWCRCVQQSRPISTISHCLRTKVQQVKRATDPRGRRHGPRLSPAFSLPRLRLLHHKGVHATDSHLGPGALGLS